MFNKPYDLVWVLAIAGLVVVTMGFGIQSIISNFGGDYGDSLTFVNQTQTMLEGGGAHGLGNTSQVASESLVGQTGEDASEASFITRGFKSMVSLGDTYHAVTVLMNESTTLGLNPIYITVIASAIIITLFVVIYTWVRGS